jgi:hypothetical protein
MGRKPRLHLIALLTTALLLAAACTSGDTSDDSAATTEGTAATDDTAPVATGPSPGVTDDTVKIGVTYVDTAALVASGLNYDLGDHEAVYTALFDQINAGGGINGRQIEPVFAPIDPTSPAPAEEACVKLTEDEDVFLITGFFLADAVTCPVTTHETAVVGGDITPQRAADAAAPWVSWTPDTDLPATVIAAYDEAGLLDGTVGVFGATRDQEELEQVVVPALEDAGVDVAETGIMDAPADDQAAVNDSVKTIASRFDASGVDTVVIVGPSGQDWPTNMADDDSYRPTLLFTTDTAPKAFTSNAATTDTSVLDGSYAGGPYGPDQARFEEDAMQECIGILTDAGLETPAPEDSGDDPSNQPYQAAFQACPDVVITQALLEAAGEDLNYGTLEAAIDGLEVAVPGDPTPRIFGPAPDSDGDPTAYLYEWDTDAQKYVLVED